MEPIEWLVAVSIGGIVTWLVKDLVKNKISGSTNSVITRRAKSAQVKDIELPEYDDEDGD